MSDAIRIALIGCGPRGLQGHVPGLQQCPDVELVAVCDVQAQLARRTADELGVDAYSDPTELLARPELDAVLIVVATKFHAQLARDALHAGKHVLLEKPMAATAAEAEELRRLAEERGLVGAIGYQSRFRPQIRWLREQAQRVEPLQVLINRPRGMMAAKYLTPDPLYGIMDYISHDLDLALWLMGAPASAVTAVLQRGVYSDTGTIDNVSAQIEFGEGPQRRVVTILSTMGDGGLPTRYEVIGRQGAVGLAGSEGITTQQLPAPDTITGYRAEVERHEIADGPAAGVSAAMHSAFSQAARGGDPGCLATFADGVAAMRLNEALIESDRRGTKVALGDS